MLRFSGCNAHIWKDTIQNIGKLSLAGIFAAGTLFVANAYADNSPVGAQHLQQSVSVPTSLPPMAR